MARCFFSYPFRYNVYSKDKIAKEKFISTHAYGFIRKRGILQNAKVHLNKKFLLTVDIKDFFKSITIKDIFHVFIRLGVPPDGG